MRSVFFWTERNIGNARAATIRIMATTSGIITTSNPESGTSSWRAMMMPPTAMIGAMIMMLNAMTRTIWTCWTSLVLRVISVGVPKRLVSF